MQPSDDTVLVKPEAHIFNHADDWLLTLDLHRSFEELTNEVRRAKQRHFLAELAICGSVEVSAKRAGFSSEAISQWSVKDANFNAAKKIALEQGRSKYTERLGVIALSDDRDRVQALREWNRIQEREDERRLATVTPFVFRMVPGPASPPAIEATARVVEEA